MCDVRVVSVSCVCGVHVVCVWCSCGVCVVCVVCVWCVCAVCVRCIWVFVWCTLVGDIESSKIAERQTVKKRDIRASIRNVGPAAWMRGEL